LTHDDQLQWEAREGRLAGIAAIASALIGLGGLIYGNATLSSESPNDDVDGAFVVHKHHGELITTAVLEAISILLLIAVLRYLYRATRYRRKELPTQAMPLVIVGAIGYAICLVGQQIAVIHAEDKVVRTLQAHPLLPKAANDLAKHAITHGSVATWSFVQLAIGLLLGGGVGLIALNARRGGLLSNFMGILGVIVGVLLVLPFFGRPPIVGYFWLIALGVLFLDRWPNGRGPAWETGEADPWPTAAEVRAQQEEARGDASDGGGRADRAAMRRLEQRARRGQVEEPEADEVEEDFVEEDDGAPAGTPHPRSKKRKRKRRR
jgi:hypothetical protein